MLEVGADSNPILKQMQDTKVSELGTALDGMKMGVAMGYTSVDDCTTAGHTNATHWHDDEGNEVKGIYEKIASRTLKDMSDGGMNGIMTGLTMGDLYDSGLLTLQDGDEYALAILVGCNDSFTESNIVGQTTFQCNLTGYMTYKAMHSTATASEFFNKAHETKTEAETTACLNKWKSIPMTEFITNILSAIR